jgi:hypothetical protein
MSLHLTADQVKKQTMNPLLAAISRYCGRPHRIAINGMRDMAFNSTRRTINPLLRIVLIINLLLLIGASLAWIVYAWPGQNVEADSGSEVLMNLPGIQQPPVHPAATAQLAEEAEVIGVLVKCRPRAYEVRAFWAVPTLGDPSRHVVNDVLAGVPVTVSYCDRLNCSQVYTDASANTPLPVGVGGYTKRDGHDSMLLCISACHYRQDTGEALEADAAPFPYTHLPYVRTTWQQWRTDHPDTDVYLLTLTRRH